MLFTVSRTLNLSFKRSGRSYLNDDEKLVLVYLRNKFPNFEIRFEPIHNSTPDFLLENSIAVEVRRLNQSAYETDLEALSIPLIHSLEKELDSYRQNSIGPSYFVGLSFDRHQVLTTKDQKIEIMTAVREQLKKWKIHPPTHSTRVPLMHERCCFLSIIPAFEESIQLFQLGFVTDFDAGGFIISEVLKNIERCSKEKIQKVKNSAKYSEFEEWWLVLVDHIDYLRAPVELSDLTSEQYKFGFWKKIIVISPLDPQESVEW